VLISLPPQAACFQRALPALRFLLWKTPLEVPFGLGRQFLGEGWVPLPLYMSRRYVPPVAAASSFRRECHLHFAKATSVIPR
jgi:hypothetical protein